MRDTPSMVQKLLEEEREAVKVKISNEYLYVFKILIHYSYISFNSLANKEKKTLIHSERSF